MPLPPDHDEKPPAHPAGPRRETLVLWILYAGLLAWAAYGWFGG